MEAAHRTSILHPRQQEDPHQPRLRQAGQYGKTGNPKFTQVLPTHWSEKYQEFFRDFNF